MAGGVETTLKIHPKGLASITMDTDCDGPYIVPVQYLQFNEDRRQQIVYGQFVESDGGEALSQSSPLVDISWRVMIKADTKEELIGYYNTLQAAMLNRQGGTIEYKPDGLGAAVLSTFFHYLQSSPPKRLAVDGANRWDADVVSDGKFKMYVELVFKTQPIATSDPDTPQTVFSSVVLENWQQYGYARDWLWLGKKTRENVDGALLHCRYDGPEPYTTNFLGDPMGHRGQVATVAGGVIFRPGRFGKGVQIAEATTNLITNPSFEVATTGWAALGTNIIARVSTHAVYGSYSLKCTYQDNANLCRYYITLTAVQHHCSGWLWIPSDYDGTDLIVFIGGFSGSTPVPPVYGRPNMSLRDQWQRVTGGTVTPVAGDLGGYFGVFEYGDAPTAGKYVYFDAGQVEQKAYSTPYCDGSLGDGHSWSGTAHASTSSRTAATLRYANPLSATAGTLALWWIPSAASTTAQTSPYLFSEGNLKAYYLAADDKVYFTDGTNTISTAALTFSADVAQHLVFTWSSSGLAIYRNGALVASGGTYTAPALGGTLWVGSDSAGANQCNGVLDDLVVTDHALAVSEIEAIYNSDLGVTEYPLKGTLPALLRLMAQPGSGQYMGRLIVFRRDSGECTLEKFRAAYEAEDSANIYPSVAWTEIEDAARHGGAYLRCLPSEDANGVAQGRRFTISNPDDHEGRFAVFGIGFDDADSLGVWTHQARLVCGNAIQEGKDTWQAQLLHSWCLMYLGEFELPAVPRSNVETGYDAGPYIDWYSTRASGTSEFRLDAIILVYVSDSKHVPTALDVPCTDVDIATDTVGVTNSEKLLIENFLDDWGLVNELAHVVAQSDEDFKRALLTAPRGDFLVLDPGLDHMIAFIQEQVSGNVILSDDFESYKGSRWIFLDDAESAEWGPLCARTEAKMVENTYDQIMVSAGSWKANHYDLPEAIDLENDGRLTDDDFICWSLYVVNAADPGIGGSISPQLWTSPANYYYVSAVWIPDGASFRYWKKSTFVVSGGPSWDSIATVGNDARVGSAPTNNGEMYWDYLRAEKADPDDADKPNATGSQWDFQPTGGAWTITEDISGAGATLACLDIESGVEKAALIDETTPADVTFRARCMAKRDAGYVGIVWRAGDDTLTEGTEDCYAALLDIANDVLLVREYAGGAVTQHDNPAFTSVVDTWYVVGVLVKGSTFRVYATAASNLTDDDDVFVAAYLLSEVTDATLASGLCGVMSISTLGRFDEVELVNLCDQVIPADVITLEGGAIFRTIAPFCE